MDTSKIIRMPEIVALLGVSRACVYNWVKAETFPAPIKLGPKAIGWLSAEIDAWLDQRAAARAVGQ